MQEPRKAQRRGRSSECISRFGVFFGGGKRFAGLTRGAVKNLRGIGVTGLCIRLPQKSGARECVYFNNVVSVAADLEKGDAKACLRATSRRSSLPVFMRPSARTGAPQGPAGHRLEVPPSWRSASSVLSTVSGSVPALYRVKISPIRISVECAGKALRQRVMPFRAAPWKSFL